MTLAMINKQSLKNKILYETIEQLTLFSRINLEFKYSNIFNKKNFNNIDKKFKLKKIITNSFLYLSIFSIEL